MTPKPQRGGPRPGAGRHPKLTNARRLTIWLEGAQFTWLDTQGDKSEVIRRLITAAMVKDQP